MAYSDYKKSFDARLDKEKQEGFDTRLLGLQEKYGNIRDQGVREKFKSQLPVDPESAFSELEKTMKTGYQAQEDAASTASFGDMRKHAQASSARASEYFDYQAKLKEIMDNINRMQNPDEQAKDFASIINPDIFGEMGNRLQKPFGTFPGGSMNQLTGEFDNLKEALIRHFIKYFGAKAKDTEGWGWQDFLKNVLPYYQKMGGV